MPIIIWKFLNKTKKPPDTQPLPPPKTKPPTAFLPLLFWSLWVYLSSFPPAEDHRWKCSCREGSTKPLKHQSPIACLCSHLPAVPEGVSVIWHPLFFPPDCFSLMSVCVDCSFCLYSPFFSLVLPALWSRAQQSWLERTVWVGVGSLQLMARNTFWNVCFLPHYGFASLGHFSIIRMLMGNSSCPFLVKLVYLEAIHVFLSPGFNNKRSKLSYTVLLN